MALGTRLAILGGIAVLALTAVAGGGLASGVAAVHPTYVDVTGQFRSEPGWGTAQGVVAAAPGVSAGDRVLPWAAGVRSTASAPVAVVAGPAALLGGSSLRDIELARAGLIPAPGCSGAACGTAGCGFLAPGCALLDCGLLNPACGLGVPVSACGLLDPSCGLGSCGIIGSGCGFGLGDDENDLFGFRHRFFDHRRFDLRRFDSSRGRSHRR